MKPLRARDLIPLGKKAVVIFTRGSKLRRRPDGSGYTGNWKIDPKRRIDVVILYNPSSMGGGAEIILARHVETRPSSEPGRCEVHFDDSIAKGTSDLSWRDFASTRQNPIRYLAA